MNKNGDYKKRLFEEYDQLLERYTNLSLFLRGNTKLKAIDFTLMYEQKEIMEKYLKILKRRIENLEDLQKYRKIILHHTGIIKN
nr:MAG TPA: hypothetical protein [Caudoviricetes sp.]DAY29634.1 MAG TPA: hypothetical protein [Caudoviricetes sp.]